MIDVGLRTEPNLELLVDGNEAVVYGLVGGLRTLAENFNADRAGAAIRF